MAYALAVDQGTDSIVSSTLSERGGRGSPGRKVTQTGHATCRVSGYREARAIMLGDATQAGFNAELVQRMPSQMVPPVLFQDGEAHREQRIQSARYFSPAVTRDRHEAIMNRYADEIVSAFERAGRADLSRLASRMAISVAGDVVGLTNSRRDRMGDRLERILHADLAFAVTPRKLLRYLRLQWHVLRFYLHDVRPAIRARIREPREDVISHLISKGRRGPEILAECITYNAAGMVTTQEFICVVVWHCLRQPDLARMILGDDREARYRLLHELLRLEPVVGGLYRRMHGSLELAHERGAATDRDTGPGGAQDGGPAATALAPGTLVELDVAAINTDPRVVGDDPSRIRPYRLVERGVSRSVMSFGAGPHRCPGEAIALAEVDIFVRRLLQVPGLAIASGPRIGRNDNVKGYELRDFILRCKVDRAI